MTFKAILFDIDGTLVDSNEQHISAWNDAFRQFGYEFDRQTIHDQVGKGGDNLVPSLLPNVTEDELEQLKKAEGELFKSRYRDSTKPFAGAKALIERAAEDGKVIVLASSGSRDEISYWIDLLGIAELVDATTSRDDVEHSKPCPDIFQAAIDKIGVAPAEAVVVGDSPYDLSAAAKCGIPSIALRSGRFADDVLASKRPLAIYDDVASLLADYERSPLVAMAEA